ncbi:MAG: GGDEF domain-containing protein [Lachnospiraceae bacterium]|nr:GGDEF domain-containing protein [Lachnospiraceae bacterium]
MEEKTLKKPEEITTESLYRITGKSFADYLGYPSFPEYQRRVSYFIANLTNGKVGHSHLGERLRTAARETEYDAFAEKLLELMAPKEKTGELCGIFRRADLLESYRNGETFLCADGDCGEEGNTKRMLVSCELSEEEEVVSALFLMNDISELYDPHSLARRYAEYDPLTKLFSRHAGDAYAKDYFNHHSDEPAALALIEVDRFKDFNERYGHHTGDMVLKTIAEELRSYFGMDSVISRNAGQEFLVLIKNRKPEEVRELVSKYSDATHEMEYDGAKYNYTLSIGYSIYPEQGILYFDLARKADKAKYNVRLGGGNGFCRFESEMIELNNY